LGRQAGRKGSTSTQIADDNSTPISALQLGVTVPPEASQNTVNLVAEVIKQLQQGGFLIKPPTISQAATSTTMLTTPTLPAVAVSGGHCESAPVSGLSTLDDTLARLLGESQPSCPSVLSPSIMLSNAPLPLGCKVPQRLHSKIWGGEFVDLKDLLQDREDSGMSFTITQNGQTPTMSMTLQHKSSPITTFDQWQSAFNMFVAIYSEKFPSETPHLMKYSETIIELSHKVPGKAWLTYDEQFRYARQAMPISWAELHMELYVKCVTLNPAFNSKPYTTHNVQQYHPYQGGNVGQQNTNPFRSRTGYCWAYSRSGQCASHNCKYKHLCQKCEGTHPSSKCFVVAKPHPPNGSQQDKYKRAGEAPNRLPKM